MSPTALRTRIVRPSTAEAVEASHMSHWRLLRYEIFMILIAKGEIKLQWVNEFIESSRSSGMCQANVVPRRQRTRLFLVGELWWMVDTNLQFGGTIWLFNIAMENHHF